MSDVRLGPVVVSGPRFAVALALVALLVVAEVLERRGRKGVAPVAWNGVVFGLLMARLGYVVLHLGVYARHPASVLYLWQGGFDLPIGAAAGAIYAVAALRTRPALLRAALLAGVVGTMAWGGWQLAAGRGPAPSPSLLSVPLEAIGGGTADVRTFVGKPLVVNLWATWCTPCQRELPLLASVAARRPGVTFVFVSQGEPRQRVSRYLDTHHLQLQHVFLDAGSRLSEAAATRGLPTTLFYDASGRLVGRWLGELSRARLDDELKRIE